MFEAVKVKAEVPGVPVKAAGAVEMAAVALAPLALKLIDALPQTSQSPAVRAREAMVAGVLLMMPMPLPVAVKYSPMSPAAALLPSATPL